ncbi:MAG: protein phosphatase 2C domain-containing protein [Armatimonadetes bacterium]|nr:protein phosphatase 2C domain-containing protein [Armatimonadota bacterium]
MASEGWQVGGACEQGTSHKKLTIPCQDAWCHHIHQTGEVIIAIADGAGSASRSRDGAQLVVRESTSLLATRLGEPQPENDDGWRELMAEVFRHSQKALERVATHEEEPLALFATTLTCVLSNAEWLVVCQVGDGLVVAQRPDTTLFTAVHPQRGNYANETYFLTMPEALNSMQIHVYREPVHAMAAMTDGLLRLAVRLPEFEPHAPFFMPLFDFVRTASGEEQKSEQFSAFLLSDPICSRTDDDKTLVLAAPLQSS